MGADLADMQLINNFNKGFRFLLCVIYVFKYAWVVPLKDKKGDVINIEMYSIHDEGKSVVAERLVITLKNKIYKYMIAISKYVYIDKLDDVVGEHNNTYHKTIKMKPVDVKDNTYIDFDKEVNNKGPKFKFGDYVRISKYKNIFAKRYMPNWSEEVFIISKIKNTVPWTYVINDINGQKLLEHFMKKNYKRLIKKNLE